MVHRSTKFDSFFDNKELNDQIHEATKKFLNIEMEQIMKICIWLINTVEW